ncbi:TPA: hypothetical protein DIC39_01590 [Patescibacteria group bacterium]|nr:MAG: hypothetical protein UY29_C0028G0009 [Parcubacteria group bacterium GW2011_GWC2_48_17]HCU47734.1 hypothetical protein [Patescibacteria group bacterium]
MTLILIKNKEETSNAWVFDVEIEDAKYKVAVPKEYWAKLTQKRIAPEELIRQSFEFLLAREPKESILREFELPIIQKYFPEYETKITSLQT